MLSCGFWAVVMARAWRGFKSHSDYKARRLGKLPSSLGRRPLEGKPFLLPLTALERGKERGRRLAKGAESSAGEQNVVLFGPKYPRARQDENARPGSIPAMRKLPAGDSSKPLSAHISRSSCKSPVG